MIFLIEFDRPSGTLVKFRKFPDSEREAARRERLDLELELNREGNEHEVVILEAPNEEALRLTHGRYFKNPSELVRTSPVHKLQPGDDSSLILHNNGGSSQTYCLGPGEAVVLLIRRSESEPPRYFVAIRKSSSSFDPATHDFQLHGLQEALLELGEPTDLRRALETAAGEIKRIKP